MFKDFLSWFKLKPKLDNRNHKPPLISEGQIWWCHLGENIGTEINGKGKSFIRPVIIFKKLSQFTFLATPLSTQIKTGIWFVNIRFHQKEMVASLNQIKIIDYKRIENFMGFLESEYIEEIQLAMYKLYFKQKIDPLKGGDAGKP